MYAFLSATTWQFREYHNLLDIHNSVCAGILYLMHTSIFTRPLQHYFIAFKFSNSISKHLKIILGNLKVFSVTKTNK